MADATCSVEDDSHTPGPLTQGLCRKHYTRSRRHGDPLYVHPASRRGPAEERFWRHVDKNGTTPAHRPELGQCWLWTGAKDSGYGRFNDGERPVQAHRFSYELHVEAIPDGLDIDHLCHPGDWSCPWDTCPHHSCVNPAHLEPVPRGVNTLRGATPSSANAAKTHCQNGHEFTEENTYIKTGPTGRPMRVCRACRRKPREEWLTKPKGSKTHCVNGHEYTPENTWIAPGSGSKYCRACQRARAERKKAA